MGARQMVLSHDAEVKEMQAQIGIERASRAAALVERKQRMDRLQKKKRRKKKKTINSTHSSSSKLDDDEGNDDVDEDDFHRIRAATHNEMGMSEIDVLLFERHDLANRIQTLRDQVDDVDN